MRARASTRRCSARGPPAARALGPAQQSAGGSRHVPTAPPRLVNTTEVQLHTTLPHRNRCGLDTGGPRRCSAPQTPEGAGCSLGLLPAGRVLQLGRLHLLSLLSCEREKDRRSHLKGTEKAAPRKQKQLARRPRDSGTQPQRPRPGTCGPCGASCQAQE